MPAPSHRPEPHHPQGVSYPAVQSIPQGAIPTVSLRGGPMFVIQTDAQRPMFGTGLRSNSGPAAEVLLPPVPPIRRGW
jgi:hypothetical protein